jgi:hypothetical protein
MRCERGPSQEPGLAAREEVVTSRQITDHVAGSKSLEGEALTQQEKP